MKSSHSIQERRLAQKRVLLLLACILMVILIWSGFDYLHTDSFCAACHSMLPFKQSMALSKAHTEVSCVECHLPADGSNRQLALARLIVKDLKANLKDDKNQKFNAYVSDNNCMRISCHPGDTVDFSIEKRQITAFREFRHTPHFDRTLPQNIKLLCTSCHSNNIRHRTGKGPHFSVDIDNCFACHAEKSTDPEFPSTKAANERCLLCHPRDMLTADKPGHAFSKDGKQGKSRVLLDEIACAACHHLYAKKLEPVDAGACKQCHPDLDESDWDPALNLHEVHLHEKRGDCMDCHVPHSHAKRQGKLVVESDCIECHDNCMTQFKYQLALYQGSFENLSVNIPDPMARSGITCSSCHIRSGYACSDGKESCVNCHVAGYEKLVNLWQKTIKSKLEMLQGLYDQAIQEGRFAELPAPIKRYFDYLIKDGSWGVHNIALTQYILIVCATPIVTPTPIQIQESK
ncbi:MAG: hypothetical protein ABIK28_23060 [Planctomycetota bacterium]